MANGTSAPFPDLAVFCANDAPLTSSREEFEKSVAPGSAIDKSAAQKYLLESFSTVSVNPVTLDIVQFRVCPN